MKSLPKLFRNTVVLNSIITFAGTMVVNVGAYLYHVVVGRIMGPDKYGEFAALFSLLFILSVPANVVQISLTKFFSDIKAQGSVGQSKSLLFLTLKYLSIGSVLGLLLYLPFIPLLQKGLSINDPWNFIWLFGIVASSFFITATSGVLNGYQKFFSSTIFQIVNIVTRLISGILLAPFGAAMTLLGMIVSNIVTLLISFFPLRFILAQPKEDHYLPKKEAFLFAFPTLMTTLAITMLYNIDVVLVKAFFSSEQAGIYASLNIFGKIIFFASSAILIVLFPMIVERKKKHLEYNKIVIMGLVGISGISFLISAGYFLLSSVIPTLLFGSAYANAGQYLGIYGLFLAFITIVNFLAMMCLAINRTTVWKLLFIGVCFQVAGMYMFNTTLLSFILSNTVVSSIIAVLVLIYYFHGKKHS
jgi:O-antigen/teichoic acid export membrane protein